MTVGQFAALRALRERCELAGLRRTSVLLAVLIIELREASDGATTQ